MAEDEISPYLLVIVAVIAVIGLGLSLASVVSNESMTSMMRGGGPMMGGAGTAGSSPPGTLEWSILGLSAVFLVAAVVLIVRARSTALRGPGRVAPPPSATAAPLQPAAPSAPSAVVPRAAATPAPPAPEPLPEPTLVKLLDEDERRMYLEIREHGGQMLQRDLVALGIFSKAKVTRVLDKLEAKGIVVREAHGMTNRVRLVANTAR